MIRHLKNYLVTRMVTRWVRQTTALELADAGNKRRADKLFQRAESIMALVTDHTHTMHPIPRLTLHVLALAGIGFCLRMRKNFQTSAEAFLMASSLWENSMSQVNNTNYMLAGHYAITELNIDASLSWALHGNLDEAAIALQRALVATEEISAVLQAENKVFASETLRNAITMQVARIEALASMQAFMRNDETRAVSAAQQSLATNQEALVWLCTRRGIPTGFPGFLDNEFSPQPPGAVNNLLGAPNAAKFRA